MTKEEARARLTALCPKADDYYASKIGTSPTVLAVDGVEWALATDGHIFLAFRRDLVDGELPPCVDPVAKLAFQFLPKRAEQPTIIAATALRAFAGVVEPPTEPCETCKGTGEVECEECDGSGTFECECSHCSDVHTAECNDCNGGKTNCPDCSPTEAQPGQLLTRVINRRLLARVLHAVEADGQLNVSLETHGGSKSAYLLRPFEGDAWMTLIMAMADHVKPEAHFQETVDA